MNQISSMKNSLHHPIRCQTMKEGGEGESAAVLTMGKSQWYQTMPVHIPVFLDVLRGLPAQWNQVTR